jgi:hypothetical protein
MPKKEDPTWSVLRAEQQERYGVAIAYVRRQVGAGNEYSNEAARVVISEKGAFFELLELPEEFVGAVGEGIETRFLSEEASTGLLGQVRKLAEDVASGHLAVHSVSLYLLYAGGSLRSKEGMFVLDKPSPGAPVFAHGKWQKDLPRVFKLRLRLTAGHKAPSGLPQDGVAFFLTPNNMDGGQCLLTTIPRDQAAQDLGAFPQIKPGTRMN